MVLKCENSKKSISSNISQSFWFKISQNPCRDKVKSVQLRFQVFYHILGVCRHLAKGFIEIKHILVSLQNMFNLYVISIKYLGVSNKFSRYIKILKKGASIFHDLAFYGSMLHCKMHRCYIFSKQTRSCNPQSQLQHLSLSWWLIN